MLPRIAIALLLALGATLLGACSERDPGGSAPDETTHERTPRLSTGGPPTTPSEETTTARTAERAAERPVLDADFVLTGGKLVDGTGGRPVENAAVAVKDGRIAFAGAADGLPDAGDAREVDVSGTTILPGFVNTHAHSRYATVEQMEGWTREGVTTVRDLGGFTEDVLERKRLAQGNPRLPRLLVAGPMITVPGGHPIPIYGPDYPALAVRGPEDARAQVNGLLNAGVDHVKIAVSGRTDTGWPELSDAEISAITDAAHARGARVSVHADTAAGLRRAVAYGVDDAAHLPRDPVPQDLIALMVERDVGVIPTIDVYQNIAEENGTAAEWNATTLPVVYDNLRRFHAAGGILALGDDYGNPGVELGMSVDEIEHWLAAGIGPMDVIVAATSGGATISGLREDLGTLEKGKTADLFVVDGDPLADTSALERVSLVVRDGEVVYEP